MADYLESKGSLSQSRDVREEAKKLNYEYPGEIGRWECIITLECFKSGMVVFLLGPGGYGAKPEEALFWIGFGWAVCGICYRQYSKRFEQIADAHNRLRCRIRPRNKTAKWDKLCHRIDRFLATWLPAPVAGQADGSDAVPGFTQFGGEDRPRRFKFWQYSLDAMLPVISLHAYDRYYVTYWPVRILAMGQHVAGWWLVTVFLASAAIL